jgi:transcriptional regulator with XRE-family HTH domain
MTPKEQFAKRLRTAMKHAGIADSITELQLAFNRRWKGEPVGVQAAWNWFHGRTMPRHEKLLVLAEVLNVDPSELEYGIKSQATIAQPHPWEKLTTHLERESIEAFLNLPARERQIVRDVILTFAKAARKA